MDEKTTVITTEETPVVIEPDYKAELEKAQKVIADQDDELSKARFTLNKNRLAKKNSAEDDEDDIDEGSEDIAEIIAKELKPIKESIAALATPTVDTVISELSSNPDEQALIRFHYENSVMKSGMTADAIKRDLQNAYAIANKPRLEKMLSESTLALRTKSQISNVPNSSSSNSDKTQVTSNHLSPEQIKYFKEVKGWDDTMIQRYIDNERKTQ